MKRQRSISFRSSVQLLAVPVLAAGMFLNSVYAAAEDPVPFKSMMQQSASSQAPVPPMPAATGASVQPVKTDHVTNGGKGMIVGGFVLFGAGVITLAAAVAFTNSGFDKNTGGRLTAAYAGGAGAAVGGVTLIAFGFHRRSAR